MVPQPSLFEIAIDAVTKTTALVAAAAGLLVVVVAGPRELKKWRGQRLAEKKADVAAEAIVATLDLLDAMDNATSPFQLKGDPEREDGQRHSDFMRGWFDKRIENLKPQFDELVRVRRRAHVYLTDDQNKALEEASDHIKAVVGSFNAWTTYADGGPAYHDHAYKEWMAVFGSDQRKTRAALRERTKAALRDAAHFNG